MSDNHPCPFCNCDETYVSKSGALTCGNCQARGPWDNRAFGNEEDEVAMWNIRMAHKEELREAEQKNIATFCDLKNENTELRVIAENLAACLDEALGWHIPEGFQNELRKKATEAWKAYQAFILANAKLSNPGESAAQ